MNSPQVATGSEWLAARKRLLAHEKEFTRARDRLSAERRALPMVPLEKSYTFHGPQGTKTLAELFEGRRQLIVYHIMFAPDWEEGCKSCSFLVDHAPGMLAHLAARDTSFVLVSRAPSVQLEAYRERMGWDIPWYSSEGSDFNYDFHVTLDEAASSTEYNYEPSAELRETGKIYMDELPGVSVFLRDGERVFHTYSAYARGLDILIGTYNYLDLTPLGRQEEGLPFTMAWLRHHDRYDAPEPAAG